MEGRPLLIFPSHIEIQRGTLHSGPDKPHFPTPQRQIQRLNPQFDRLQKAMDERRIQLQDSAGGILPEQTLVLETSGSIQSFQSAVKRAGLEWLNEIESEGLPPDEDFYFVDKHGQKTGKQIPRRLFLIMSDQKALQQLLDLWKRWQQEHESSWERGLNAWRSLFAQLKTIRFWSIKDRLYETGILENWKERIELGEEIVPFEIELWFRQNPKHQNDSENYVTHLIEELSGKVITRFKLEKIGYHALLGELPIQAINTILEQKSEIRLFYCDHVMFFRPVGQCACLLPKDEIDLKTINKVDRPLPQKLSPVIAVLDGLPLEKHHLLDGRLIVDDPDGWESSYPADARFHGTTMSSLIIHGDLGGNEPPLERPIYIRPIMQPKQRHGGTWEEAVPENLLPVDLVHRSVCRLFESEAGEPPVAPQVRIINFSIGDPGRPFDYSMSPWARLLDWLACQYKVLFIVSSGNCLRDIQLNQPRGSLTSMLPKAREEIILRHVVADTRHRRLLTPAESINALTIGALHSDRSNEPPYPSHLINPYSNHSLPSPINTHGLGYRKAIKPELLIPGGQQIYQEAIGTGQPDTLLQVCSYNRAPGQEVATCSQTAGDIQKTRYTRGTSNSTALTSRLAAQLYEILETLWTEPGGDRLAPDYDAVLLKALLVHSAYWGKAGERFIELFKEEEGSHKIKECISRFLGYGIVNPERVLACTEQRATLLGYGNLTNDNAHEYTLPLPPSLSGKPIFKRLTITLAWLTPISPQNQRYRKAHLWFEPKDDQTLKVKRHSYDDNAVRRGTVQHEIFEGKQADVFQDGDAVRIQINCREDAPKLREKISYGLVVTLEVKEGMNLPIYEEIKARIMIPVSIRT
ncbi:MAG: S8 family peptidase [Candidatus Competibacteraceae bacterium]